MMLQVLLIDPDGFTGPAIPHWGIHCFGTFEWLAPEVQAAVVSKITKGNWFLAACEVAKSPACTIFILGRLFLFIATELDPEGPVSGMLGFRLNVLTRITALA